MFSPKTAYDVIPDKRDVLDFHEYRSIYVDRHPYQRKSVWSLPKKQSLLESLFRRYYIPKLVLREVRLTETTTIMEVVDGQQRINTVQDFFDDKVKLPKSLETLDSRLVGKTFGNLPDDLRQ